MSIDRRFVRGAVGNALVWGSGWFLLALALCAVLLAPGLAPAKATWLGALAIAVRAGVDVLDGAADLPSLPPTAERHAR